MTHVHNNSDEQKTAENLLKLILQEKEYIEKDLGLKLIGWVSDASGESPAAQKSLVHLFPHLLTIDCYTHQVSTSM